MLLGFIRDPHFFTSVILPANIVLAYVNTTKSPAHSFRSSPFCFLPPDSTLCLKFCSSVSSLLTSSCSQSSCSLYRTPDSSLCMQSSCSLYRTPDSSLCMQFTVSSAHSHSPQSTQSVQITNWTLTSFLCLSYLSLLTLPYPVYSYYQNCTVLLTASNWTALWQVRYFIHLQNSASPCPSLKSILIFRYYPTFFRLLTASNLPLNIFWMDVCNVPVQRIEQKYQTFYK